MKPRPNRLQLKTKPLFKFSQEGKQGFQAIDPTITITITGQTITTFVMKR